MSKLPAITLAFWLMKICATTLGETAGDLLSMTLSVGYGASTLILLTFFLATVTAQLMLQRPRPALYWTVILATSTAGTTLSDYMDRTLGLGYAKGVALLLSLLLAVFAVWRWTGQTFAVAKIAGFRGELLYWTAILLSNTLGTALGDYLADDSGLGFAGGALLVGTTIGLVAAAYRWTTIPRTPLFWLAFILTRPFGATLGDVLTKAPSQGGLGLGTVGASAVLLAVLVGMLVRGGRQLAAVPTQPAPLP